MELELQKKKKFKKNFISQKYNLKETFNILFIGRLIEEKNFEIAIKIFKKLNIKNKRLIIVGDFDELSFSKKKKLFNIKVSWYNLVKKNRRCKSDFILF